MAPGPDRKEIARMNKFQNYQNIFKKNFSKILTLMLILRELQKFHDQICSNCQTKKITIKTY